MGLFGLMLVTNGVDEIVKKVLPSFIDLEHVVSICGKWSVLVGLFVVVFFFSSRRRHTRSDRDWSSDVCSSDLDLDERVQPFVGSADDVAAAMAARDAGPGCVDLEHDVLARSRPGASRTRGFVKDRKSVV